MNRKQFFANGQAVSSQLAEIQQLRAMSVDGLVLRYVNEFGKAPRTRQKEYLWKRLAWKVQEKRLGGLSNVAKATLEHLISQIQLPAAEDLRTISGKLRLPPAKRALTAGSVLTKEWRGTKYNVRFQSDDSCLLENSGVPYRSLSAVAFAITGAKWNGKLFFGLTDRKPKSNKTVTL